MTALDRDAELLAVLADRAGAAGLAIETVVADAAAFVLPRRFMLIAVPMQTLQLLPGAAARGGFYASAARALAPGGLVAAAIADALETFDERAPLPAPDLGEADGVRYISQPVAVREQRGAVRIERVRLRVTAGGERTTEDDVVVLQALDAAEVAREAAPHGLWAEAPRTIAATEDHVGSTVVVLRG